MGTGKIADSERTHFSKLITVKARSPMKEPGNQKTGGRTSGLEFFR